MSEIRLTHLPDSEGGDVPSAPETRASRGGGAPTEGKSSPAEDAAEPVMDLRPEGALIRGVHAAGDLLDGLKFFRLGWTLGWLDIKLRYRGSMLGPFWMTISTAIMVGAMGVLYATLFHIDLHIYLPFLTFSLVLWSYLNSAVADGCVTFTGSAGLIHTLRMPFSVHVLRTWVKSLLTFLHSAAVVAVVFAIFKVEPRLGWGLPVGVGLWIADTYALILLFGVLGARFRDMPPVSASVMQIFFFITPILWKPDLIYTGRQYMLLDPCYPIVEMVRGPLMGESLRLSVWLAAAGYSALLWVISFLLFARMRSRLSYWV